MIRSTTESTQPRSRGSRLELYGRILRNRKKIGDENGSWFNETCGHNQNGGLTSTSGHSSARVRLSGLGQGGTRDALIRLART